MCIRDRVDGVYSRANDLKLELPETCMVGGRVIETLGSYLNVKETHTTYAIRFIGDKEQQSVWRLSLIHILWVGLDESTAPVRPPARGGRPPYTHLCPPVVRSFAPPTGGYDSSDRKRSLPSSPALVLLYNSETSNPL